MSRKVLNMDFDWRFHRGDVEIEAAKTHDAVYMSSKSGRADPRAEVNFDDSAWRRVDLPHDFFSESEFDSNNLQSHGYRERTNGWYRKTFKLDKSLKDKQLFLCFEGTAVNAVFFFNNSIMERSFSAYTETAFDITERAYFGDRVNVLTVYITGLATEGWWYEGAGIYRHVRLYAKDKMHIAHNGIFAKPVLKAGTDNDWTVELKTDLENSDYKNADNVTVKAELLRDGKTVAQSESDKVSVRYADTLSLIQCFDVENPDRWDVDSPNLYTLKVSVLKDGTETDSDTVRIGFRTIAADKDKCFILNGRPLFLKGTCNHQDHAGCGVAVPDSVQYWRIKKLKEMGTNALRCSHNLMAKEVLDACDELGLVVMDENRRFEARKEVLGYLEIMVKRDCNHPSVCFYSLFNEEPIQNSEEGAKIYRKMRSFVEHLDDSRIFTGAINGSIEGAGLEMDITGINYNIGAIETMRKFHPEQPIFGAESNSAVTTRGCYKTDMEAHVLSNYDEEAVPWGQTIGQTWDFVRNHKYFGGIFIWTGFDYRGEPSPFQWPSVSSQFGIMDTCGFPKDSYYFNKACFDDTPMVHLLPHWNWNKGDTVRVMAVSNCDEVELFLNGRSLGRQKDDLCRHAQWYVEFEEGTISAKAYKNGKCAAETSRTTTGTPVAIKLTPNTAVIKNDGHDTVLVNCSVVDKDGREVPTADNHIKFEVNGDAVFRGVGNGDPNSHESDIIPERNLFAGYCQLLVMSKPLAKKVSVKAVSDGLESAEIEFTVENTQQPLIVASSVNNDLQWVTMSAVTDIRPDATKEISSNDNNSFLPITFLDEKYQLDYFGGWRIYRARPNITEAGEYILKFPNVYADVFEVYANGKKIFESDKPLHAGSAECGFTAEAGQQELRVLVYVAKTEGIGGGIAEGIRMFKK